MNLKQISYSIRAGPLSISLFNFAVLLAQQMYVAEAATQPGHLPNLSSEAMLSRHDTHLGRDEVGPAIHQAQTMIKIRAPADGDTADDPVKAPKTPKKSKKKSHKTATDSAASVTSDDEADGPGSDAAKSPGSSPDPIEASFNVTESALRGPLETFHPLLLTYVTRITDVGARACKNPDMSPMGISTKECEDINNAWSNMNLAWPDVLENYGTLGAGPGMEALASEWRASVGKLRQQFGDDLFAFEA
ncbi:unnamed protein product [Sympodiomycopsis kandeliae]